MSAEPVTVVVTRRVKAGREADYEAWLARLLAAAAELPGYLGTTVQRPTSGSRTYTSIFRFATVDELRRFEASELRRAALREVVDLVEADAAWDQLLTTITIEVFLMTYVLMPRLTRWLARWIYPARR